jgi:hypothetical protein
MEAGPARGEVQVKHLCRVLLLVLAVSVLAAESSAQENVPVVARDTYWMGLGLGVGSEDLGGQLNGSYQFGANLLSLRTAITVGPFDDGFNDYALLYGRATRPAHSRYHVSAAAGIALVDGCNSDGFLGGCQDKPTVVGLPLELQAFWRPGKLVGVGLYGFVNLNSSRSFAGLTLGLQVGRLR